MTDASTLRRALVARATRGETVERRSLRSVGLTSGAAVLDVGAGDGALLSELSREGHAGRLDAIDPCLPPTLPSGIAWVQGTAEALPYPDETFDLVLLFRVILHLERPTLALSEARRVLRPGGRIVVAVNAAGHLARFWSVVRAATDDLPEWSAALAPDPTATSAESRVERLLIGLGERVCTEDHRARLSFTPDQAVELLEAFRASLPVSAQEWDPGRSRYRAAVEPGLHDEAALWVTVLD